MRIFNHSLLAIILLCVFTGKTVAGESLEQTINYLVDYVGKVCSKSTNGDRTKSLPRK